MNKKFFFVFLTVTSILLSLTALTGPAYAAKAPFVTGGGWIASASGAYHTLDLPLFDGSYYQRGYAATPVTWEQARDLAGAMTNDACQSAHLATVTSAGEQVVISYLMSPTTANGWLGGYQDETELSLDLNWQWITGEPWGYTNWAFGEPNDSPFGIYIPGSEQNLETYQVSGVWNDAPGWEPKSYYIIEYEDCYLPGGKATFNLQAQYKKGDTTPSGHVNFNFPSVDLNFQSTSLDMLSLDPGGSSAEITGTGTINGLGSYFFMVWVEDGTPDMFRIKIWWEDSQGEHVIYDNGNQAVGGGNIVTH